MINFVKTLFADALRNSFQLQGNAFGYAQGGTVTQATDKSTGVTLQQPTGEITLNNAALNAGVSVSFVLTNAFIKAGDYLAVMHVSGATLGSYVVSAVCAAGTATITVTNRTAGNLSEAIVIKYFLHKAATA